ncbi:TIGR00266 family protein [Exilibacterium tricleocarpae]|uniref:TIGR00266 family protein n=1 Tax=Exilibacterium tricleocarpae TaxID=2591008 RepID=A0A545TLI0_9GAMM|nr:TIGR00266 family protein [Exilibacterium tricleocarpae]TQV78082.1 TIGR00266 family protein [Exilibacterium tricleocarpae]
MDSHDVDYEIIGTSMQMVEVLLDPDETVIAEAGAMNYYQGGVEFATKMGDGADPEQGVFGKLFSAGKRLMTGESLFMTHFSNRAEQPRRVAFAAPYPGTVIALDLNECDGEVVCQKDSFLCAALGTRVDLAFSKRLGAGFFGGEGFVLQRLKGDGMAFVHAGGSVIEKTLVGDELVVDTGCLVGFTRGVDYDIRLNRGLKSLFFGGEGVFLTHLSGHGKVWLQSLPFSRLADRVIAHAPSRGGRDKGEK